jgi:hypothetical protein
VFDVGCCLRVGDGARYFLSFAVSLKGFVVVWSFVGGFCWLFEGFG